MEEIKKAIKHFECVKNGAVAVLDSGFGTNPNESNIVYKNRKLYAELAINALEKQMPKKVNIQRYIDTKCDCGYEFSISYGDGYYGIPFEKKTKYCPDCGQALDWSETNE